jgi:tRNA pseudouridine55 synthase
VKNSRLSSAIDTAIEGVLVIDKPTGISSYDVIRVVKKRLSPKRIGHTGTLDPLASGVLPLVMNRATRVVPFLDERVKTYEGTLRLGVVTDSDDSTGRVMREIALDESRLTGERIRGILERFMGRIKQVPPMYSAAKHNGRPLYALARRGIQIERKERDVEIFSMALLGTELPLIDFRVSCSRGTYVRTLAREIGEALEVGGTLCRLRRTRSGPFTIDQALTLEEFKKLAETDGIEERIIPLREALGNLPEIEIDCELGKRIRHGHQVLFEDLEGVPTPCFEKNQKVKILHRGDMVAIAEAREEFRDRQACGQQTPALSLLRVFA